MSLSSKHKNALQIILMFPVVLIGLIVLGLVTGLTSLAYTGYYGLIIVSPLVVIALVVWLVIACVAWARGGRRTIDDPTVSLSSTGVQTTPTRKLGYALGAIVAVAALPYAMAFGANLVAAVLGCEFDVESGIHPCVVLGIDFGRALYVVSGVGLLLAIPFVPVAAVAFVIWLVVAGRVFVRRRSVKTI